MARVKDSAVLPVVALALVAQVVTVIFTIKVKSYKIFHLFLGAVLNCVKSIFHIHSFCLYACNNLYE